uniref:Uncharacterized protein n=1 Tax=Meloidogyne hapla TaxID=6305 RepID=A0A1I8B3R6_MELHA
MQIDRESQCSSSDESLIETEREQSSNSINITSNDQKSLMKSANNVFDMCQLSKNCIDTIGAYKYEPINSVKKTKGKNNSKKKEVT